MPFSWELSDWWHCNIRMIAIISLIDIQIEMELKIRDNKWDLFLFFLPNFFLFFFCLFISFWVDNYTQPKMNL